MSEMPVQKVKVYPEVPGWTGGAVSSYSNIDQLFNVFNDGSARTHIDVMHAELVHGSAEDNHRPMLMLYGELRDLEPSVTLPMGIEKVVYPVGLGPSITGVYHFTDQQLQVLVGDKGYFSKGFAVPEDIRSNLYEIDLPFDITVLLPVYENDVPVVVPLLSYDGLIDFSEQYSGYDLVEVFPDYEPSREVENEATLNSTIDFDIDRESLDDIFAEENRRYAQEEYERQLAAEIQEAQVSDMEIPSEESDAELESYIDEYVNEFGSLDVDPTPPEVPVVHEESRDDLPEGFEPLDLDEEEDEEDEDEVVEAPLHVQLEQRRAAALQQPVRTPSRILEDEHDGPARDEGPSL